LLHEAKKRIERERERMRGDRESSPQNCTLHSQPDGDIDLGEEPAFWNLGKICTLHSKLRGFSFKGIV
jgi:hypothetical protein